MAPSTAFKATEDTTGPADVEPKLAAKLNIAPAENPNVVTVDLTARQSKLDALRYLP